MARGAWRLRAAAVILLATGAALSADAALAAKDAAYRCASGRQILAVYSAEFGARLSFDGRSFALYPVRAASGARYATEQGLSPDRGLQWWIKGDEATLSEMLMDHTAPEPRTIDTCRAIAPPDGSRKP
jgi:membrane-bound inhibitor of C-type lysozyme